MDNILSKRGEISYHWEDIFQKNLSACENDPFDEKYNSNGYINLATPTNEFCVDHIEPKLSNLWICDFYSLGYKDYNNSTARLRNAMANIMTEFLESYEPVTADDLFCFSGVTSCIDILCHSLADPGDAFLVPTPMHSRMHKYCMQRSNVELFPVHVIEEANDGNTYLTMEKITDAYKSAILADNVVRGILLINPNDPLGDIYSPEFLMDVMTFCKEKNIHLIVNEVYALSTYSQTKTFHSILKFPIIPNPNITHVVYGLCKDFGFAGLKIGVIHTKCKQLQQILAKFSFLYMIPCPIMEIVAEVLEDVQWCREYVGNHRRSLRNLYELCYAFLMGLEVNVRRSSAGFCLWIDLRKVCGSSFDGEREFTHFLLRGFHLYIGPGEEVFCAQPGWFRIAFTRNPIHVVTGLNRLKDALNVYKPYKLTRYEISLHDVDADND